MNKGRFPEDNTSLPKTPLPVVSVWFPTASGLVNDIYRNNDAQFMQALANPEIGGFYDIVRPGQGEAKSKAIIGIVKKRFNEMWIVKWRVSCLNPTVEQTFNLLFVNTKPVITPDGTFKDVPIGIDPTQWPLDINMARTKAETDGSPIYPGGKLRVYGDFCWGGDKGRAESYFVPAGTKPSPQANSQDPSVAKAAMQQLIQQGMRGAAEDANDTFAIFDVPDDEKVLEGSGDNTVARVVIYDNKAHRASGHDEKTVLTLKATKKPFNLVFILGVVGLLVVIVLLVLVLMRGGGGGGGGGKKGRAQPQAPVVAGRYEVRVRCLRDREGRARRGIVEARAQACAAPLPACDRDARSDRSRGIGVVAAPGIRGHHRRGHLCGGGGGSTTQAGVTVSVR